MRATVKPGKSRHHICHKPHKTFALTRTAPRRHIGHVVVAVAQTLDTVAAIILKL